MSDKLILVVHDTEPGNHDLCYDLDDPETPKRFFNDARANWERGDDQIVSLQEMTQTEWEEVEKASESEDW